MDEAERQYLDQTYGANFPNKDVPVTVNQYALRVGNRIYRLEDISTHRMAIVIPSYATAILSITLGIIFVATGISNGYYVYTYFPRTTFLFDYIPAVPPVLDVSLSKFELLQVIGAALCLCGLISLLVSRKLYVLRVVMGAEEMSVFSSRKKKQLVKIANTLGKQLSKYQSGQQKEIKEYSHSF